MKTLRRHCTVLRVIPISRAFSIQHAAIHFPKSKSTFPRRIIIDTITTYRTRVKLICESLAHLTSRYSIRAKCKISHFRICETICMAAETAREETPQNGSTAPKPRLQPLLSIRVYCRINNLYCKSTNTDEYLRLDAYRRHYTILN